MNLLNTLSLKYELRRFKRKTERLPFELDDFEKRLIYSIRENNLSMCSYSRLASTAMACKYICENNTKAVFVECGVWRGGNGIIAAAIFEKYKIPYKIYLFDTFKGMTKQTKEDKKIMAKVPDFKKVAEVLD